MDRRRPNRRNKAPFANSSVYFQERFPNAPFSVDNLSGLVWTEGGLTGEIKLRLQIPPA